MSKPTAEQLQKIKEFFTQQRATMNAIIANPGLEEPLLSQFKTIKGQYDSLLEGLPLSDMVPAAQESNWNLHVLFNCLMSAQQMMGVFQQGMENMKTKATANANRVAELEASMGTKVEEGIKTKVAAGELVPKSTLNSEFLTKAAVKELCDAAKREGEEAGLTKGRQELAAREARLKTVGERTKSLQQCGLPIPDSEDLLADDQAKFDAAVTVAKTRHDFLTKKRITENGVLAKKVWASEAAWKETEELVNATVRHGAEPLLGGDGNEGGAVRLGAI